MSVSILDALKEVVLAIKDWADENKVQKVDGKDLSTNDYTTEEKNKVASIPNDLIILNGDLYLAHDGVVLNNSAVPLPSGGGSSSSSVLNLSTIIYIPVVNWFEVTTNALYSQYVTINEVTENTKVDLNPTAAQIASLQSSETILTVENDGTGAVKVWAIGGKPTTDFYMQVYLTEVAIR